MINVLITRLPEDGAAFAEALGDLDIPSVCLPLQRVRFLPIITHLHDIQALLFTSKNGVRAFCHSYPQRDFLVYCVGNGTEELARKSGFKRVYSAQGNVYNLVDLIKERGDSGGKTLLHISGQEIAHSLEDLLPEYPIQRIVGYEIVDQLELTEGQIQDLKNPKLTHVSLFSPKSGKRFVKVVKKYNCKETCRERACIVFSQEVAAQVEELPWKTLKVLGHPSRDAMLEYFHDIKEKD